MWRATFTSLLARRYRLVLSGLAIVLGVAFVAGSLVFTDTLGKTFTGLMKGAVGDVVVAPPQSGSPTGTVAAGSDHTIPASVVRAAAAVPGAARADGNVTSFTTFVVAKNGTIVGGNGAPGIAVNYTGGPAAGGLQRADLVSGHWPTGDNQVVLDVGTADRAGYQLGEQVPMVTAGPIPTFQATLVGTLRMTGGSTVGASIALLNTATMQHLVVGGQDVYTDIWVTARPGVSQQTLRNQVAAALPPNLEVTTGDRAAEEAASQIQEALSFITTFLLVFAGVALVVGSFLIVNTFSMLVAQRSRDLALLRALDASRRQVNQSVLAEATVIALLGSTLGLGLGVLLALGIRWLFGLFGLDLTGTALVFAPRTPIAAYGVGIVITLVAAYLPARRAGQVPPVAAMREATEVGESSLRRRLVAGLALLGLGVGAVVTGLLTSFGPRMWLIGLGIGAVVLGAATTSPLLGRPVVAVVGAAYRRIFGTVGLLAAQNAGRNPRRTGATASALMIGVTLVAMMGVVGSSAKASLDRQIDEQFVGDVVVSNLVGTPFSPTITARVAKVPGVEHVTALRYAFATVAGEKNRRLGGIDPGTLSSVVNLDLNAGSLRDLDNDGILVDATWATRLHLTVGSRVTVAANDTGGTKMLVVRGTYDTNAVLWTRFLVTQRTLTDLNVQPMDAIDYVKFAPGADRPAAYRAIVAAVKDIPLVTVKDQQAYAAEQREPIDQMLALIYALLGLAIVIAVLGIVNTLGLSVIERTREIGLLRAVGLSRRQLRRMLTLESVLIALLGAVIGIVLGLGAGVVLQHSLADRGIDVLAIPWSSAAAFLVIAVLVGVLAALWPGRRAGRLDILRAIAAE